MKSDLLPKFNADEETYNIWLLQITAWFEAKNLGTCTDWKNPDPDLPVEDGKWSSDEETKEKEIKAVGKQKKGVALMTVALHETLLDLVRNCKSKEHPHGLCYKIFEYLDAIYNVKDEMGRQHAREQLRKIRFKEGDNPEIFFIRVLGLYNRYVENGHLNERDVLDKIVTSAPEMYTEAILKVQEKENATVSDYRAEFHRRFRAVQLTATANKRHEEKASSDSEDEKDDGKEKVLIAGNFKERNENCFKCNQPGHRAFECPVNDSKRFKPRDQALDIGAVGYDDPSQT